MKLEELKIKINSLAYESKIIRQREQAIKARIRHIKTNRIELAAKYPDEDFEKELSNLYTTYHSLHTHRRSPYGYESRLREESRFSQLAYAYLKGVPYQKVEKGDVCQFPFFRIKRLTDIINGFGRKSLDPSEVSRWIQS